jgi:predicted phosphodiesterase
MKSPPKWTRFVYLPDPHGHHVNKKAWAVVRAFVASYKPDRVVYGGDVFDLSPLRKGASAQEQAQSIEPDFKAGMDLFDYVPPTDFVMGNHDYRAWAIAKDDPGPVGDFCRHLVREVEGWAKKYGVTLYPYRANVFCKLGPTLKAMHGNVCNLHAAKSLAEAYGAVIAGHTHSVDYYRSRSLDVREAWTCGCLCDIWQRYNETRIATLRHTHGFAWGEYSNRSYDVNIAQPRNGVWRIGGRTW